MLSVRSLLCFLLLVRATVGGGLAQQPTKALNSYAQWTQGVPSDPAFFPIAVWVQSPRNAQRFRQAGINLYVGLWNGPTEEQLSALKAAGMFTVCDQNATALNSANRDIILAWMHGDEPDNAQARGTEKATVRRFQQVALLKIILKFRPMIRQGPCC